MNLYWKFGLAFAAFAALVSGCLMYGRQEYRRGEIAATARISAELAKSAAREQANKHAASQPINTTKPAMSGRSECIMWKWKDC